uniref:Uncharacterized protein n=1 Tax=Panagrolaimus sp. ES5 TaxID=591445 RepID=A0AC34GL43_9BILA
MAIIEAFDVSVGKGFASEILRCIIKFEDSESSADVYATILKIPGFEAMKEAAAKNGDTSFLDNSENLKNLETVHECECDFYENLAPILDVPLPKVYKTLLKSSESADGCIHMEDLTLRGRTLPLFENNN